MTSRSSFTTAPEIPKVLASHVVATSAVINLVKCVGNYIGDWDCVADTLDQSYSFLCGQGKSGLDLTSISQRPETKTVIAQLEGIEYASHCLSDENLVKFMTSFVSLSMNELVSGRPISSDVEVHFDLNKLLDDKSIAAGAPSSAALSYLRQASECGIVGYAFRVVVSTAKANAHRIFSVWQMVSSHFRLMASLKVINLF